MPKWERSQCLRTRGEYEEHREEAMELLRIVRLGQQGRFVVGGSERAGEKREADNSEADCKET